MNFINHTQTHPNDYVILLWSPSGTRMVTLYIFTRHYNHYAGVENLHIFRHVNHRGGSTVNQPAGLQTKWAIPSTVNGPITFRMSENVQCLSKNWHLYVQRLKMYHYSHSKRLLCLTLPSFRWPSLVVTQNEMTFSSTFALFPLQSLMFILLKSLAK